MTHMRATWLAAVITRCPFLFDLHIHKFISIEESTKGLSIIVALATAEKHLCGKNVQFKFHVDCSGEYREKPTCDSPTTRSSKSL